MRSAIPDPGHQQPALDGRTADHVAMERAAQRVSDVLLNLEHSIAVAKKALKVVHEDGVDTNAELALTALTPSSSRPASDCSKTPVSPATTSA